MNWNQMTFGKKITIGFGTVLLLLSVIVALSYTGVGGIVTNATQVIEGNKLDANLAQKEVDHLNWVGNVNALLTDEHVHTLSVETDDHKCGFGKWLYGEGRKYAEHLVPSLAPILKQIEEPHRKLHESAIAIGRAYQHADLALGNFLREKKTDHMMWMDKVKDAFVDLSVRSIDVEADPNHCSLGKWMNSSEMADLKQADSRFARLMQDLEGPHSELHHSVVEIERLLQNDERDAARDFFMKQTKPLAYKCLDKIDKILEWHDARVQGMQQASLIYTEQTMPALQTTQKLLGEIRGEARKNIMTDQVMLDMAGGTKRNVTVLGIAAIAVGMLLAFVIANGIVNTLKRISNQIELGAEQVSAASGQVSSSSQSLAEGASEQAASIEEASSSMEEMASMTRQNAENAGQADRLMKEANKIVQQANESMGQLTESMQEITEASEETSKIIKTIDEIAFQTNLLALNAAVEAARAGDAGAGFAVVADEVRNLAMRAAEAAKNTAVMIEDTVKKVNSGSELVSHTNDAFAHVSESSQKVGELVDEISSASTEQAQGIEQVNKAVTEMDKVVQQNAANAEETASASEELSSQAMQMKKSVEELMAMVGKVDKNRNGASLLSRSRISGRRAEYKASAGSGKTGKMLMSGHGDKRRDNIISAEDEYSDF